MSKQIPVDDTDAKHLETPMFDKNNKKKHSTEPGRLIKDISNTFDLNPLKESQNEKKIRNKINNEERKPMKSLDVNASAPTRNVYIKKSMVDIQSNNVELSSNNTKMQLLSKHNHNDQIKIALDSPLKNEIAMYDINEKEYIEDVYNHLDNTQLASKELDDLFIKHCTIRPNEFKEMENEYDNLSSVESRSKAMTKINKNNTNGHKYSGKNGSIMGLEEIDNEYENLINIIPDDSNPSNEFDERIFLINVCKKYKINDPTKFKTSEELFNFFEQEGKLYPDVLKLFSTSKIKTIDFEHTYETKIEHGSLCVRHNYVEKFTKPLYMRYTFLKNVSFKNVFLSENEVRYLISHKFEYMDLSGTEITSKSLKYFHKYSKAKETLRTLVLSRNLDIGNECVEFLSTFNQLETLYLEDTSITLDGFLMIGKKIMDGTLKLKKLFMPQSIFEYLSERHCAYRGGIGLKIMIEYERIPKPIEKNFSHFDYKKILKFHKKYYPNIYIYGNYVSINRLDEIYEQRKIEEHLWHVTQ